MGNTIGKLFRVTTFGESHGEALGCVIDGCPAQLALNEKDIQCELDKRRPGQSSVTTARKERDKVKILSGIFKGKTLGTPIAMIVFNSDARSQDYEKLARSFRSGHADYVWQMKYGFRDYRGGGRSSGRETVSRVMAGAVAKKFLARSLGKKFRIYAYAVQIGNIRGEKIDCKFIEKNPVRAADRNAAKKMEQEILRAKAVGDSVGGIIEITVSGVPLGLGEPVFDKLNADLAKAMLSIGAVRGVEFGNGFKTAGLKGSEQNDPKTDTPEGISGGISNGKNIVLRIAIKAPASIAKLGVKGRHDPCIVPRVIPVTESMTAIILADHYLLSEFSRNNL